MSLDEQIHNADQAQFLLDHPLNVKFWAEVESRIVREFAECPSRDDRGRLELQNMLKVVRRMQAHYQEYVNTGKIARKKLAQPDTLKERWQRFR